MNPHSGWARGLLAAALVLAGLSLPGSASAAVDCSGSTIGTINFGAINPLATSQEDISGTLTINCTSNDGSLLGLAGVSSNDVKLDFSIDNGSLGTSGAARRIGTGAGAFLPMQLYQNASRTVIWGGIGSDWPTLPFEPPPFTFTGSYTDTFPVYATLVLSPVAEAGDYHAIFSASVKGEYSRCTLAALGICLGRADTPIPLQSLGPFIVKARIVDACRIDSTANMDFGSVSGLFNAPPYEATSTMSVTCTNGSSYSIGLSDGVHPSGGFRRMADGNGHYVKYQLYQGPSRNNTWGDSVGSMVTRTGAGQAQAQTVYGRVPAQPAAASGQYSDTVQVTVTY